MRVVIVGAPQARARLRASLDGSMEIVGEFPTLSVARSAGIDVEAFLVAPNGVPGRQSQDDGAEADAEAPIEDPLTARELQVIDLLAQGLSNKGIAARLGISDQTVKFHVAPLSGKLGALNRTDAVRRAVRRGLIAL